MKITSSYKAMILIALFSLSGNLYANECVILLHGLARSHHSMKKIERALSSDFIVINQSYPSRQFPIEELSGFLDPMIQRCPEDKKIHFVTHSLGGILLRYYVEQNSFERIGRVVMLSPPNHGSELVDKLAWITPLRWILGPAFTQLGTDNSSIPKNLPEVNFDTAIIMGTRSIDPLSSWLIPGPDDGRVSIPNANIDGANHFRLTPSNHAFIMQNESVITTVKHFLKYDTLQ